MFSIRNLPKSLPVTVWRGRFGRGRQLTNLQFRLFHDHESKVHYKSREEQVERLRRKLESSDERSEQRLDDMRKEFEKPAFLRGVITTTVGVLFFYGILFFFPLETKGESLKPEIPRYASLKVMEKAVADIRQILGQDSISTEESELLRHGNSEWGEGSTNIARLPIAVAYPKSTAEVSEIAKICNKYRVPMIPFSGGSSIEGAFTAPYGGLSIDFSHMDKVVQLFEEDMDVVVQPGVNWLKLNEQLAPHGLFFPVDPGPTAQFGGMVATNCSGTNATRYGAMKDWVLNLTVVLADGSIIKTKGRPHKSSAGYNLNSLFVGSEGTLGIVTEITVKLAVIPQHSSVAVVTFPTISDAAATAAGVMKAGIPIAAMELIDEVAVKVVNKAGATAPRVWKELPTLFFKFSGSKASVDDNIKQVKSIASFHKGGKFEFARDEAEQKLLWSARKEALWSLLAARKEGTVLWSTDVAVPMSRLVELVEISKKEMDSLGIFASLVGHLGDGNFHEAIMYDPTNPEETAAVKVAVDNMIRRAIEMEGTSSGEHGIGLAKKDFLMKELGPDTINAMKSVKASLDPLWLMNPGKIMDVP